MFSILWYKGRGDTAFEGGGWGVDDCPGTSTDYKQIINTSIKKHNYINIYDMVIH